ncbi:MAG: 4-hydroxyphenylacetate 3-monooxygenase, oxygenase component [Actinomycetota bacterium]|nr:4-hydroxyphenylacetate 3-monooxygenase, oxygenase component [Actinomycetota bacterium]MEE3256004.1 4-hydroxyphenylacetate 3-monooxygenase, oxygenase component [Actinomycetota bacterium]|tara:strand:+ start:1143 stop:2603 length:1461 start_codon:yes stop_codon:yes gene_type:complete
MPARTGKEVIDRLQSHPPNLWLDGQLVEDPTQHPKTRNAVRSLAALYDLQYQDDIVDVMTFESPSSGDRVGRSFVVPESKDDLRRRSEMHKVWADASLGHMGRSPDYMNVNVMAAGMAGDYFEQVDQRFGQNIKHYFEYVRENDLALTHALTNPQVDKSKQANELADPYIALGLVEETSEGILVRGARMLATLPISDEILIFPSTVIQGGEEMRPYALGFSVPNNTPGLRFQCREPLDQGRSHVDHPLGSRFDELDAMVIFDDVIVPWDRVFLIRDVERANQAYARTGAVLHMAHQVVNLKIAKTEAILGTLQSIIDMIGTGHYPHVQEMVAEVIITLEIMKALKLASEEEANVNEYGVMTPARGPLDAARNHYPSVHKRLMEVLQLCSSSGLIMVPSQADWEGERSADIDKFLQGKNGSAEERLRLFRLAWDMTISGFGGRQALYERFFFGDPVRMKHALYGVYDRSEYVDRVQRFVANDSWPEA